MDLLIVRHAIAHERNRRRWRNDDLRPLTPAGIRKFSRATRGIRALGVRPARVLTSPLVRAQQTAELLASGADWPEATESPSLRPQAPPASVLAALRKYSVERIAVVGHEPSLSRLIGACVSRGGVRLRMKKGGIARIRFAGKPREGRGELVWLLAPRVLRALSGR